MFLIVDCGSSKLPNIVACVEQLGYRGDVIHQNNLFKHTHVPDYKGIIISGAPILLTELDPKPYLSRFRVLLTLNLPILGICFGHQILGMLHGASIQRCPEDRADQWIEQNPKLKSPLFKDLDPRALFREDHCECITLPEKDFDLLASSSTCHVEAMQHHTRAWYGVQFHPEVSGENGLKLLSNFAKLATKKQ